MLAVVALLCVLVIFVSPLVDLPYTALRSLREARLLPLRLAAAATTPSPLLLAPCPYVPVPREDPPLSTGVELLDVTCSRLC